MIRGRVTRLSPVLLAAAGLLSPLVAHAEPPPPAPAPGQALEIADDAVDVTFQVRDVRGAPVPGARIEVIAAGVDSRADAEGRAKLALPTGHHHLRVTAEGMEPQEREIDVGDAPPPRPIAISLSYRIGDVVVTATRSEKPADSSPVPVQVVGRQRLEQQRATSLSDSLDQVTGVRVENNCQNCGFPQVRFNGLEGQYTQILLNGRPVFSGLASVYALDQIPEEMIGRLEIVRGGGSALYGGNAVGGVLNIVTTRPTKSFFSTTLRGGVLGPSAGEARVGAIAGVVDPERKFAAHIFGMGQTRAAYDRNGDGFSDLGQTRLVGFGTRSYYTPFRGGEVELDAHVLREHRRGGDQLDKPEHEVGVAESVHTTRYGGELRWKHILKPGLSYELSYGVGVTERNSYYGGGGNVVIPRLPGSASEWTEAGFLAYKAALEQRAAALGAYGRTDNQLHAGEALVNIPVHLLGDMVVTAGVQAYADVLEDAFPVYGRRVDQTFSNIGAYVQHDWLITPRFELLTGVRVDKHSSLRSPVVNPRVALMVQVAPWLRSRTVLSTGFRAPQVFDEDLHITQVGGRGLVVYNAADLRQERSYSGVQQLEVTRTLPRGATLRVAMSGFVTSIDGAFALREAEERSTDAELALERVNRGKTLVAGAEIEAGVTHALLSGSLGFSLLRSRNGELDPIFGTNAVFRSPEAYGFAEISARPVGGLELATWVNLTGPMYVPHYAGYIAADRLEHTPWFAVWNANIGYRVALGKTTYLNPFVGVVNILDHFQSDLDRGASRDSGYFYGPRTPRSFFGGVKVGI